MQAPPLLFKCRVPFVTDWAVTKFPPGVQTIVSDYAGDDLFVSERPWGAFSRWGTLTWQGALTTGEIESHLEFVTLRASSAIVMFRMRHNWKCASLPCSIGTLCRVLRDLVPERGVLKPAESKTAKNAAPEGLAVHEYEVFESTDMIVGVKKEMRLRVVEELETLALALPRKST